MKANTRSVAPKAASPVIVSREPAVRQRTAAENARRDRVFKIVMGCIVPVGMLVSWELSAQLGWIDARFFSQPSEVLARAVIDFENDAIWGNVSITLFRLLIGYIAGSLIGVIVGVLLSQSRVFSALFEPILRALYVIPKLAILPLLLLLFGLGEMPKLLFIGLGTFYIVAFTTLSAASLIPKPYHEVAASYGLSTGERFRWLILPASLPQIVGSLKVASGIAMLLTIAVEFVNAHDGIGFYTWHAWTVFIPSRMFVGIIIISILGVAFNALVGYLGGLMVRWSEEEYRAKN